MTRRCRTPPGPSPWARWPGGAFAGVDDVGGDLDMPRLDILALAAELTEVAGFEVGLEEDLGRRPIEPERRARQQNDERQEAMPGHWFHLRSSPLIRTEWGRI